MLKKKKMIISLVIIVLLMVTLTMPVFAHSKSAVINGTDSYKYSSWIYNADGNINRRHYVKAFDSRWISTYYLTDYINYNGSNIYSYRVYATTDYTSSVIDMGSNTYDIRAYLENLWQMEVYSYHKVIYHY